MESKEALEYYLSKKHPMKTFTEQEKEYVLKYSFDRENAAQILKSFGWKGNTTKYYEEHGHVKNVVGELQMIRNRFNSLKNRCEKFEGERKLPFGNSFASFLKWWCSEIGDEGLLKCCYCGVNESVLQKAFEKIIKSKKFTETLQIERMDSEGAYCATNCHFACPVCNNAKSDMISKEDFETYFVPGIKKYWIHIKKLLGE